MTAVRMWHFQLRPKVKDHPFMWGEFVIVSTGMFAAVSDYGNYAYAWRSIGGADIRKFLLGMKDSPHYFMNKFDPEEIEDWDRSAKLMKDAIIKRRRRDPNYGRERARREWKGVCCSDSAQELVTEHLDGEYYHFLLEYTRRRLSYQVEAFVKDLCIPHLLPELEKSLKEDP